MFWSRKSLLQENRALKEENAKLVEQLREQEYRFTENMITPDLVPYAGVL